MHREDKERVVAELTEKLRDADTLIVADYRGLTMPQIDALRGRLLEHGARFTVVKNTLTRRAAEAAGADALLALLEGPSAIAFIESDGDMVAVAKALADSARDTKVLEIRGGIMQGRDDLGRRRRGAREAPAVRRVARPGARRGDRAAHAAARARQRAAPEPRRADRRPDRAARRRDSGGGADVVGGAPPKPKTAPEVEAERQPGRGAEPEDGARIRSESRIRTKIRRHERWRQLTPFSSSSGAMTVLELVELKKKIEDEWGVTAAAPVAVAAPAARRRRCRRGRGEDLVRRRPHGRRAAEDPGDQGRPRGHRPRPQGGQGPRRRRLRSPSRRA